MNEEIFKARTKQLALKIIELIESLPRNRAADVIGSAVASIGHVYWRKL